MPKFVIHKKGFFYTDENFEPVEGSKGTIMGAFPNLERAKAEKEKQDLISMQKLKGMNAVDFFFDSKNYEETYRKMEEFYQREFNLTIPDKYYFQFPKEISEPQARVFLEILGLTFHDIVEYPVGEILNPNNFNLEEQELGEF
jgi:hypothetical protein